MRILLDTHAFLWFLDDAPELSPRAKEIFINANNILYLSTASIWEMAIKASLGKLTVVRPLSEWLPKQLQINNIATLEPRTEHVLAVESLPFHHRDPFDRLLIAQAKIENISLLSADKKMDAYSVRRIW